MKQSWKRLLTVVLAFALVLSVLPQNLARADDATYGKVTTDQVYLRKQPGTDADYWFRMNTNHVARILGTSLKNGKSWYKVETSHPDNNGRTYTGYIMADFFALMTADEVAQWVASGNAQPSNSPSSSTSGTTVTGNRLGEITANDVNFRKSAGLNGGLIMKLERGAIVELLTIPDTIDSSHWFRVRYNGTEGYIMSTYIRILPEISSVPSGTTIFGYVKLKEASVNLREGPGTSSLKRGEWRTKGEVLPYVSKPVSAEGSMWYEVVYSGNRYWVCGDFVQVVDSTGKGTSGGSTGTTVTPTPAPGTSTTTPTSGYVITTIGDVNMRILPFGERITWISKGVVLPYSKVIAPHSPGNDSSYTWYYVSYVVKGSTVNGYVRSDVVVPCNADGSTTGSTGSSGSTVTEPPSSGSTAPAASYLKTIATGVNVRQTPGGKTVVQVRLGTVLTVTGAATKASTIYTWYPVRTPDGKTGYVRSDVVTVCDASGNVGGSSGSTATEAPSTSGSYGYVKIMLDRTNIRKTPNGDKLFQIAKKGGVYPLWGTTQNKNNETWYPIYINGNYAWVRGDCVMVTDANGNAIGSTGTPSTPSTPSTPGASSTYLITILNDVNLRAAASKDSASLAKVDMGTVFAYKGTTGSGSNLWYKIIYNNKEMWVMGSCVRVMTQAEYDSWLQQHPNDEPQTEVVLGYVKTTANKVFIRDAANGNRTAKQIEKAGTVLPYTETQVVRNYTWYYITDADGFRGWITGEFCITCDKDGSTGSTVDPGNDGTYVPPTKGQEASYSTLKEGSSGDAVLKLVTELKMQGYYTGTITSTYTSAVTAAVKALQKAKGLSQTGIADEATQHALFQTVPKGTGSSSDEFTYYPIEKVDWFKGSINSEWARGTSAKVYDVKSGIVWTAYRWAGGNHVDAEPLTAADTVKLCRMYGVSNAQQIYDDNHWQGRPSVVLVGNHNYACSLMGMPHAPDSGVIKNNNFPGPLCIHFTNSKTHDSGVVRETHQEAIEYAYQNWPWGKK